MHFRLEKHTSSNLILKLVNLTNDNLKSSLNWQNKNPKGIKKNEKELYK